MTATNRLDVECGCPISPNWKRIIGKVRVGLPLNELYFATVRPGPKVGEGDVSFALDPQSCLRKRRREASGNTFAARVNSCVAQSPFKLVHEMKLRRGSSFVSSLRYGFLSFAP
jgi:hypothetical protein